MPSTLVVEIQEDGTLKFNAMKMIGTEEELLSALNELASEIGGNLEVEKHVEGAHHHHHGDGHHHHHHKVKG